MVEKRIISAGKEVSYEGYFNVSELYYLIDSWLFRAGYEKKEDVHDVKVFRTHRDIVIVMAPERKLSGYVSHQLEIGLKFFGIKDVTINVDGKDMVVQEGKASIEFEGVQQTNRSKLWKGDPWKMFTRIVIDKLIYPGYIEDSSAGIKKDIDSLADEIKAFFNMTQFKFESQSQKTTNK